MKKYTSIFMKKCTLISLTILFFCMHGVMAQSLWQAEVDLLQAVTNNFGNTVAVTMTNPANQFTGDGSGLTNLGTTAISNGVMAFLNVITNGLATTNYINTATNNLLVTITNIAQSFGGSATNAINNNNGVGTNVTVYGTLTSTNLNAAIQTATNNFGNSVAVNLTNASNQFSGGGGGLTNLNYSNITNQPVIPSTNGFVDQSITNGLASTNYTSTITNGLATTNYVSTITNGLATTNYVSTITNGLATTAYVNTMTNGLTYLNMTIVPWNGATGTQTVSLVGNNLYWYSNAVSVNQTILVSNFVAGGWVDIEGRSSGTPTVTLQTYAATTNWLSAIWTAWGSGKFDRLGIDCISTSPSTNLTLGFKGRTVKKLRIVESKRNFNHEWTRINTNFQPRIDTDDKK